MNFGEMKAAVISSMARDDIPAHVWTVTQSEINSRFRVREMEVTGAFTALSGTLYVDLGSQFLMMRHAYVGEDGQTVGNGSFSDGFSNGFQLVTYGAASVARKLEQTSGFLMSGEFEATGQPRQFAIVSATKMRLNPVPDQDYTIIAHYVRAQDVMTLDADEVPMLTAFPSLYIYNAQKHAAIWAQDVEMAQLYAAAYNDEAGRVIRQDRVTRFAGPLQARLG